MSGPIIKVLGLGKRYRLGRVQGYRTLRESLTGWLSRPLRRRATGPAPEEFWALRDVSFEVQPGEVLGIIGRNGAGKSTLLKVLSRITSPTEGFAELSGRVASLLEVGTGFHPELTGRENIFLNGAILGMSSAEIRRKFDEIVAFSEVEKFLDTPVKHYSSGMYTRLAFAVAAHLEPEILIVDEVLAVGDAQFQKKCMGKMGDVAREGRTVLFVSHNMPALANLCSRAILLTRGRVAADGPAQQIVNQYISSGQDASGETVWDDIDTAPGNQKVRLHAVRVLADGQAASDVEIQDDVQIQIEYWCRSAGISISTSFHLIHQTGIVVFATGNDRYPHDAGVFKVTFTIPGRFLNDGYYSVNAFLLTEVTHIDVQIKDAVGFTVHDTGKTRGEYLGGIMGVIRPTLPFTTARIDASATTKPAVLLAEPQEVSR
jgi:lipopolysaccharide transport system ATP-binding protein